MTESAVNVMKPKRKLFNKSPGILKTALWGREEKAPRINQTREDVVQVVRKKALLIHGEDGSGTQFNAKFCRIFFLSLVHKADLFFCPCFGICDAVGFTDVFFGAEPFHNEGFVFVHPNLIINYHPFRCHCNPTRSNVEVKNEKLTKK